MRRTVAVAVLCVLMMAALLVMGQFDFVAGQIIYSLVSVLMFSLGGLILKLLDKKTPADTFFRLKRPKLRNTFLIIRAALTLIFGSFTLNFLTSFIFKKIGVEASSDLISGFATGDRVMTVITLALLPAVFEELFFRGAVLSFLEDRGVIYAVLLSAVFFTVMHGLDPYFLSTFFAGVVLSSLAELTGNILTTMIVHFVNNIMSYVLILYAEKLAVVKMDFYMLYGAVILFLVSAIAYISGMMRRVRKRIEKEKKYSGEELI